MKAGPELDRLMAEVMGWRLGSHGLLWFEEGKALPIWTTDEWKPSADMNHAMIIAEHACNWDVDDNMLTLSGQGPDIEHKRPDGKAESWWEAEIDGTWGWVMAKADKPALAICLAVRKLKEKRP